MARTIVPEEEKRASGLTDLKDNIRPTDNRVVLVESDSNGDTDFFWWDASGEASNADGVDTIESNITEFADGGSSEGLWRRAAGSSLSTTDDLTEGSTNLYYTSSRFDSDFSAKDTDDLTEGATNLYYTDERAQDAVNSLLTGGTDISLSYDDVNDSLTIDYVGSGGSSISTTDDLTEGSTNLYYTDNRARNSLSASGDLSYDSSTGDFSVTTYKSTDFDSDFSGKDTDDLSEGASNLYYTDERAQDAVDSLLVAGTNISLTYDDANDSLTIDHDGSTDLSTNTTDDLTEGSTNLYYTDSRVDTRIDSNVKGGSSTFSGDGSTKSFDISHGFSSKPTAFNVQAETDDASAISHATAGSSNITVNYDTAPPSGTNNVVINYIAKK